jgi:preprotein translocase subunit SecF
MYFRRQNWNIVGRFGLISAISYAIIFAGFIALFMHHGLKLGLSFTGGTEVTVRFTQSVTQPQITAVLTDMSVQNPTITAIGKAGEPTGERYTIETQQALGNESDTLWAKLSTIAPIDRGQSQIQSVGPALSREYLIKAFEALAIAIVIQFLYIAFRFEWNMIFGLVTVIALVRDSAMMIGIYAMANRPADDAFLAAVLTVVGYSVMDTIVILDRIRENTRIMADSSYEHIVNTSILQTMTRSLNTLATVVVTLVALFALGGVSLQNFAFALLVGICSGGYHSIFYSAPLVVRFRAMQAKLKQPGLGDTQAVALDADLGPKRIRTKMRKDTPPPPTRYKRRRNAETSEQHSYHDEADADLGYAGDESMLMGHEEIILNLDDEETPVPHAPEHGEQHHGE